MLEPEATPSIPPAPAHVGARRIWVRRAMVAMLGMLLLAIVAVGAGVAWVNHAMHQPAPQATTVVIASGTPFRAMARQLHAAGSIAEPNALIAYALWHRLQSKLQAGEYAFTAGSTPVQVLDKLARGDVVVRQITIPEGWTSARILAALAHAEGLEGAVPAQLDEASLLPDTYRYQRGETRQAVLDRMQSAWRNFTDKAWAAREPAISTATLAEAMVLASIVERETGMGTERAMVAGVYHNRLRIGMPLQADPTVLYGITLGAENLKRPLSKADLRTPTPYNTYTQQGLPVGAICHPGRAAIEATLHPATTNALYFVATGAGEHRFSATLEEHNRNVALLRNMERARAK